MEDMNMNENELKAAIEAKAKELEELKENYKQIKIKIF